MMHKTGRMVSRRRAGERGFVLLMVFAVAAGVAIMLYLEAPRVAFQHQRNKEAMLVDRGEQYKRALELYVKKYNKFPQTLDELEKPDNVRLLRRRYKDPMTGKDEWRLIHIDNSGQYVDSLIHKKEEEKKERHLLESDVQGVGSTAVSASDEQGGPSPFLNRTASDRILPGTAGGEQAGMAAMPSSVPEESSRSGPAPPAGPEMGAEAGSPFAPGGMLRPGGQAGQGVQQQGQPGVMMPGQGAGVGQQGGQQGQGGMIMPGQGAGQQGGQQAGQAGQSGGGFGFGGGGFGMGTGSGGGAAAAGPVPSPFGPPAPGGGTPNPQTAAPGQRLPGQTVQQQMAGQQQVGDRPATGNDALRMIQNQLSRPTPQQTKPGGTTFGSTQTQGQGQGQGQLAGGLAGVASQLDLEGIRVYNERTNYKEWEFLADLQKIRGGGTGQAGQQGGQGGPGGQQGAGGRPGQQQGQPGGGMMGSGGGGQGQGQGQRPGGGFGFGGSGGGAAGPRPPRN
jgi:hypothetical protein